MNIFKRMFGGMFQSSRTSYNVMKNSAKSSMDGIKEMKKEFKKMDFKKMPKGGYVILVIMTVFFILLMVAAYFISR